MTELHHIKDLNMIKDLKDLIVRYFPNRALCSQTAGFTAGSQSF